MTKINSNCYKMELRHNFTTWGLKQRKSEIFVLYVSTDQKTKLIGFGKSNHQLEKEINSGLQALPKVRKFVCTIIG